MWIKGLAVAAAGTLWLGLLAGQGCPGFLSDLVSVSVLSAGDLQNNNTGTSGNGGNQDAGDGGSAVTQVDIDGFAFIPKVVTIKAGQTVRWTNRDFPPHAVRSGDPQDPDKGSLFFSGTLGVGKSFEHTFETPGTYTYHCQYHYSHVALRDATVEVVAAD